MNNQPRIVVRSRTGKDSDGKEFRFSNDLVRSSEKSKLISDYRSLSWNSFKESQIPDGSNESWRRSSLKEFNPGKYSFVHSPEMKDPGLYAGDQLPDGVAGKIIYGQAFAQVTHLKKIIDQGIIFSDLMNAENLYPEIVEKALGKVIDPRVDKFASAAGALAQFGSILYVPRKIKMELPFIVKLEGSGNGNAYFSHNLIYLEPYSSATLVFEHSSLNGNADELFHSGLIEIILNEGANLTLVELQSWGAGSWNFEHAKAQLYKDASIDWTIGSTGSKFSKVFSDLQLSGQGSSGKINGFYFSDQKQHLDHETSQNHFAPNTTSDLLFKGVLTGNSRTVWRGMIYVSPEAVKTDGYQANRNLILSEGARADSIPGLEILTDDVRCTHGATVGMIDKDQIFYLESRGIPKELAEKLIVEGYFEPVMERIPLVSIRERFSEAINKKMSGLDTKPIH